VPRDAKTRPTGGVAVWALLVVCRADEKRPAPLMETRADTKEPLIVGTAARDSLVKSLLRAKHGEKMAKQENRSALIGRSGKVDFEPASPGT
jgi:hypothetical protein